MTSLAHTEHTPSRPAPAPRSWTGLRMVALGMLVLQITWALAVVPFGGSDEFDHAYRAAAAAHGQIFVSPARATRGTGAWLEVPNDIVAAARPQCQDLRYTHNEDCVGTPHGDMTRIASGAGRYHPLFYVVVGAAARPFHGHAALYAMRFATVLLAWLLFCLALASTRRWASTPWPVAALAVACTPVLVFSSSIMAPNGVEMMAGLALWASTLGILRDPTRHQPFLVLAATISGSVLVTARSLGPVWCLLILVTVLATTRPPADAVKDLLRRTSSRIAAGVVLVATILSTVWIVTMHTFDIGQSLDDPMSTGRRMYLVLRMEILWVLQSIAAFPFRNQPTKTPVYACYLALFLGALYLGFRFAERPLRSAIALTMFLSVAFPTISGLNPGTYPGLWQGRYGLPYSVGILLLVGFALDRAGPRLTTRLRVGVLGLFVVAQTIGPVDVLRQGAADPLSDYGSFPHPASALIAVAAATGAAVLWWAASATPIRPRS